MGDNDKREKMYLKSKVLTVNIIYEILQILFITRNQYCIICMSFIVDVMCSSGDSYYVF